jgi:hypothetical protein
MAKTQPKDTMVAVAAARLEGIAAAERADAAERAALEARQRERDAARQAAEAELRRSEEEAEAAALRRDLPALEGELVALGATAREAFADIRATVPNLLAAQGRYEALQRQADRLRQQGHKVPRARAPALGGIARAVLMVLVHAIRAQETAESK